jgi:hypothetical protein
VPLAVLPMPLPDVLPVPLAVLPMPLPDVLPVPLAAVLPLAAEPDVLDLGSVGAPPGPGLLLVALPALLAVEPPGFALAGPRSVCAADWANAAPQANANAVAAATAKVVDFVLIELLAGLSESGNRVRRL